MGKDKGEGQRGRERKEWSWVGPPGTNRRGD